MENSIQKTNGSLTVADISQAKEEFALILKDADNLDIVNNVAAAFDAAIIVTRLKNLLTQPIVESVFVPLMNLRFGFLTDQNPDKPNKQGIRPIPYSWEVVRNSVISAAIYGLLPLGNQFNIIAGNMYPTKEGYTALLTKLKKDKGLIYSFEFDPEVAVKSADPHYVAIPCCISYKTNNDSLKGVYKYVALVRSHGETSTTDELRGKAERKCKKAFFEFLTGIDLGDGDASDTEYTTYQDVTAKNNNTTTTTDKVREILDRQRANKPAPQPQQTTLNIESNETEGGKQ